MRTVPVDGSQMSRSTRIGFFDEFIEPTCLCWIHSFFDRRQCNRWWGSGQETIEIHTKDPVANETYTVQVMQDGVQDLSGNTFANTFEFTLPQELLMLSLLLSLGVTTKT